MKLHGREAKSWHTTKIEPSRQTNSGGPTPSRVDDISRHRYGRKGKLLYNIIDSAIRTVGIYWPS